MTEQEAGVLRERLTRIWAERVISIEGPCNFDEDVIYHKDSEKGTMRATLEGTGAQVHVFVNEWAMMLRLLFSALALSRRFLSPFFLAINKQKVAVSSADKAVKEHFEQSWIGLFRRAAWLCGFPLEASAEEKAEWTQGFTEEEVEAWKWKLKM